MPDPAAARPRTASTLPPRVANGSAPARPAPQRGSLPTGQQAAQPIRAPLDSPTGPVQPGQPPRAGRRGMRTGTAIFLITAGAILRFAVPAGSLHGLNVHVVGVILILAGVLGLLLPRLAQAQQHTDRLRRWVRPNQPRAYDTPPTGIYPSGSDDSPALVQDHSTPDDRPPLVDDLLNYEHPLL
jgi:hypothetical protein